MGQTLSVARMATMIVIITLFFLPVAILDPQEDSLEIVNQFIISRVGEEYFYKHYVPLKAEQRSLACIFAEYKYEYPPYIENYRFSFYYDTLDRIVWSNGILLMPQAIKIDGRKAIKIAKDNGILLTPQGIVANIYFDWENTARFVWCVIIIGDPNIYMNKGIIQVILDAETGEILRKDHVINPRFLYKYILHQRLITSFPPKPGIIIRQDNPTPPSQIITLGLSIFIIIFFIVLIWKRRNFKLSEKWILNMGVVIGVIVFMLLFIFSLYSHLDYYSATLTRDTLLDEISIAIPWGFPVLVGTIFYRSKYSSTKVFFHAIALSLISSIIAVFLIWTLVLSVGQLHTIFFETIRDSIEIFGMVYLALISMMSLTLLYFKEKD